MVVVGAGLFSLVLVFRCFPVVVMSGGLLRFRLRCRP